MTEADAAISRSFDRFAPRYDELVEANPLHAHLRQRSLAWLDEAFVPGMHVLEIGCGTGTEAAHLARRSVEVTALDISEAMVRQAELRIHESGLERRVHLLRLPSSDIGGQFGPESFDGAYASFGALNCGPPLRDVVGELGRVLKGRTSLVISVISRPCAWELLVGAARLNPRKAFRRLRESTPLDLAPGASLSISTYSERDVRKALSPLFRVERIEGWLVALPPPYLADVWRRMGPFHEPAFRAERHLSSRWPFRGWGEHLHVWARRCA